MNYYKLLHELSILKGNEKKTDAQIRELQEKKLRQLLAFSYARSDYYREAFTAAGLTAGDMETAPLSAFPTLDKAALLEQFDRLTTVPGVTQEELRRFDWSSQANRKDNNAAMCVPLWLNCCWYF